MIIRHKRSRKDHMRDWWQAQTFPTKMICYLLPVAGVLKFYMTVMMW